MEYARKKASATVLNGYLYIAGGLHRWWNANDSVELYDPKSDEWTRGTPMIKSRSQFALNESEGFLYAMGDNSVIERFDTHKNRWTEVSESNG